jgi:hypothetical protein
MTLDEAIRLKADLLLKGLRISDEALTTVGQGGLEKVFWVFEMTPSTHYGTGDGTRPLPNDMLLPYDLYADVRYSPSSPYTVHKTNGSIVLIKDKTEICEVKWPARPDFYDKRTASGELMKKVSSMRGDCGLRVCFDNMCHYFSRDEQCKFCNIVPTRQRNRDHVVTRKQSQDVYDCVKEAIFNNPVCSHLAFTAGAAADDGLGNFPAMLENIKPLIEEKYFPIVAAITATRNIQETEYLHSTGISSVAFNIEIWDEELFKKICPGKHKRIGRDRWLESLKEARKLFKPARTMSSFVVGLEPKKSLLEGIEYLTAEGIFPIMSPFVPMVETEYEGGEAPETDWIWDVHERATEILYRNLPDAFCDEIWNGDIGICPTCTTTKLFFDFMRRIVPRENPRRAMSQESVNSFV